jgi:hypothetical protein
MSATQQQLLAFMRGATPIQSLPEVNKKLINEAVHMAVIPGVLGRPNWEADNGPSERVFNALVELHKDRLHSGTTVLTLLKAAVDTSTVQRKCVIPLVDDVWQVLKLATVATTATLSSLAFITQIDTIITTIIVPSVGLLSFLGDCWMYLSDQSEASPIPEVVRTVFGAACDRRTLGLIFYAILLRLRANPAHAAAVNLAAAAAVVPPAGAAGIHIPNIMQRVYMGSMNGFRWFLQYLCSVPEFICIGLSGDNPIVTHINQQADYLIGSWIVSIGDYIQKKYETKLSTYLQQQYFIRVFAPAFVDNSNTHKLDSDVFRILWAQEAEKTVAAMIRYMIEAERKGTPLRNSTEELILQHQCREELVLVLPRCMDGMITTDELRRHEGEQRQGASARGFQSSGTNSNMAQPGTLNPCLDPDVEEQVLLIQHFKEQVIILLGSISSMRPVQQAGANAATLVGYFFKDDWNAEPSAKPTHYSHDEMAQLKAAPADMRTFFNRLIQYIAKYVYRQLQDNPDKFGPAVDEGHAYKKWSEFLDSIMRISILLKTQYKIDFDSLGRLILSLNADGIEPLPEIESWLKTVRPVEYANPSLFNRGLYGIVGNVLSKVVLHLSQLHADFFLADEDDYEAAFEICLGPKLNRIDDASESTVAAVAAGPDQENTSFFAGLLSGLGSSNQGWRAMMKEGCSSFAVRKPADAAAALQSAAASSGMEELVTQSAAALQSAAASSGMEELVTQSVVPPQSAVAPTSRAEKNRAKKGLAAEAAVNLSGLPRSRSSSPPDGGGKSRRKSRKNSKKTTRRNKGRKSSKTAKKSQQQRARNSIRRRRSSRKGRK